MFEDDDEDEAEDDDEMIDEEESEDDSDEEDEEEQQPGLNIPRQRIFQKNFSTELLPEKEKVRFFIDNSFK